ncbi:MAG: MarR family transcriptional regulator [Gordonia sp. (in: high G+C Gram-positive bacteria)]
MPRPFRSLDETAIVLTDFVNRVLCTERAATADALAESDLTISQIRMLFILVRQPSPISVHELAEHIGLSLAATGRGADRLVTLGLVDRREDPSDRRVKRLSLTADGSRLIEQQCRFRTEDAADLLTDMPHDVRDRLAAALGEAVEYLPPAPQAPPESDAGRHIA